MKPGDRLTLTVERPAAGGRMIARHDGAIVLVSAVIPGETVEAEVEKMQRGTIWARPTRILQRSADRVAPEGDWRCGGNVFAHMSYDRQLAIKREIVRDAFTRIGRMTTPEHLPVIGSAVDGYRMRARLHVQGARVGFFREGTHQLCAAGPTRQLQPDTVESLERLAAALESHQPARISELEVSESCDAGQRVVHLEIAEAADPARLGPLPQVPGVTGASCGHATGD
ncbi:MAG: TRAM domain-containing protein, partial [Acidobacteria bacterium]|nr:TRAM domain-containing protein [Acidobacteriota bacterium]